MIQKPVEPADPCELSDILPQFSKEPAPWWQDSYWLLERNATVIALVAVAAAAGYLLGAP